jgi:hypothetical protein
MTGGLQFLRAPRPKVSDEGGACGVWQCGVVPRGAARGALEIQTRTYNIVHCVLHMHITAPLLCALYGTLYSIFTHHICISTTTQYSA